MTGPVAGPVVAGVGDEDRGEVADLVVSSLADVVLAFAAQRVEEIVDVAQQEPVAESTGVLDLQDLVAPRAGSSGALGRRMLRVRSRRVATHVVVGESVSLVQVPKGARHALPAFLASLWHELGVQAFVRYGETVALLVDVDALLDRAEPFVRR